MYNRLLIIFLLVSGFAICQKEDDSNLISRFRPGLMWYYDGIVPITNTDVRKYDRLIFDVTYNDWIGDRELFQNHWASFGLNTNFMFDLHVGKSKKGGIGIGVQHSYIAIRHNRKFSIDDKAGNSLLVDKQLEDEFIKSSTTAHAFSIPIELRYHSKNWRHFKIHFGATIGYQPKLIYRFTKRFSSHDELYLRSGFPDENQFLYSVYLRTGIRNWALYSSFNINSVFSSTLSTQLNIFRFGISFSMF